MQWQPPLAQYLCMKDQLTSGVVHKPQKVRAHASLRYALENPVRLPTNSGAANIPPLTAKPGILVNIENFEPITHPLHLIVEQCDLYA